MPVATATTRTDRTRSSDQAEIGQRIQRARNAKGPKFTQTMLAEALYQDGYRMIVGIKAISLIETGARPVPHRMREHLEHVLGIELPERPR